MEISVSGHNVLSESAIRAQVHRGNSDLLGVLRDDWLRLCVSGGCNTPYNRPEYFAAYVKAFEPHSKIVVVTVWIEGSLVGILPLVEAHEIWYGIPVSLVTTPHGDHYPWFDLICKEGIDQDMICDAVLHELNRLGGWDAIRLRQVAEGSAAHKLLEAGPCEGLRAQSTKIMRVPYVTIDPSKDDVNCFLGTRSGRFRYMVRRALRKAAQAEALSVRRFETADACPWNSFAKSTCWNGKAQSEPPSSPTPRNNSTCSRRCPVARPKLVVEGRSDHA